MGDLITCWGYCGSGEGRPVRGQARQYAGFAQFTNEVDDYLDVICKRNHPALNVVDGWKHFVWHPDFEVDVCSFRLWIHNHHCRGLREILAESHVRSALGEIQSTKPCS